MLYANTGFFSGDDITYSSKFLDESVKVIEENNITNMFVSLLGSRHTAYFNDLTNWLQNHKEFKYYWAAGNDSGNAYNHMLDIDEITGVAAYTLMADNSIRLAGYSSITEKVDFSAPSYIYTNPQATSSNDSGTPSNGTSFSTPYLCAMSCLVDDFFIDKTGKPLTRDMMMQFFKDNCMDIGNSGFDNKTGWGTVVLPEPDSIEIEKYAQYEMETPIVEKLFTIKHERTDKEPYEQLYCDKYQTIVEKIEYSDIQEIGITQANQPSETMQNFYDRQGNQHDILINGGLFNMSNGKNILSFVEDGVEQNYQNGYVGFGTIKEDKTHIVKGIDNERKWWDFMSAYPLLIDNYVPTNSQIWGGSSSINYNAKRQVVAYNDDYIFVITVDKPVKFETVQTMLVELGVKYAFNLDGGGSVRKMISGKLVNSPSQNRPVDNFVWIDWRKDFIQFPSKYTVSVKTALNVRDNPNGNIINSLNNNDIIYVYDIKDDWAKFTYNLTPSNEEKEYYYCSSKYIQFIENVTEPEPEPIPEPVKDQLDIFEDKDDISVWAINGVKFCVEKGYINGSNNKLNPKNPVTKEELCTIIYRIFNKEV